MRRGFFTVGAMGAALWLAMTGCMHEPAAATREASLRVMGSSLFCGRSESTPAVRQAGDVDTYDQLLAAHHLKGMEAPDFSREIAVLAALGQRPTLGYRLEPSTLRVPVQGGIALVTVEVRRPPPGAMTGQTVTSPCLLLAIERKGISVVRVQEQDGTLIGQTQ
jgi:hypothetical protein